MCLELNNALLRAVCAASAGMEKQILGRQVAMHLKEQQFYEKCIKGFI